MRPQETYSQKSGYLLAAGSSLYRESTKKNALEEDFSTRMKCVFLFSTLNSLICYPFKFGS